jgi:hypothetical protein
MRPPRKPACVANILDTFTNMAGGNSGRFGYFKGPRQGDAIPGSNRPSADVPPRTARSNEGHRNSIGLSGALAMRMSEESSMDTVHGLSRSQARRQHSAELVHDWFSRLAEVNPIPEEAEVEDSHATGAGWCRIQAAGDRLAPSGCCAVCLT